MTLECSFFLDQIVMLFHLIMANWFQSSIVVKMRPLRGLVGVGAQAGIPVRRKERVWRQLKIVPFYGHHFLCEVRDFVEEVVFS